MHLSPELDAIADYEISTDRTYVALTIIDDDFASGEYIIEAIGKTIPGYTDWTWGNEYWPIALTNAIKAPAAAVIADIQPSGGQGSGQSTVHLTMTNNFAVNQQVTFLVALFDGDGKMSGLKTVSAVVRAGEAFVQDIDMQLAGAAKLKIMSVDSKFAPMLGELILELQPTPQ